MYEDVGGDKFFEKIIKIKKEKQIWDGILYS